LTIAKIRIVVKKTLVIICCFIGLCCFSSFSQESRQTLVVSNLNKVKGQLYIGWYTNAGDFRKAEKSVLKRIVNIEGVESASVIFENVPSGTYAIAVFLDKNNNGKIDTNLFGIPKEKYGFSNNVYPLMRAASFQESAFSIKGKDETITIRLK
jgi:uncharacterized protein (DUF2141 family)